MKLNIAVQHHRTQDEVGEKDRNILKAAMQPQ